VPVGVPIHLSLQSKDVIHDWWVEPLGQKTDVIPGRTTHTWFRADKTGTFVGQCAEFCGPGHATMLIKVEVVSRQDFGAYLADKAQ
jgi:cytochrome c oxidase subunit 2